MPARRLTRCTLPRADSLTRCRTLERTHRATTTALLVGQTRTAAPPTTTATRTGRTTTRTTTARRTTTLEMVARRRTLRRRGRSEWFVAVAGRACLRRPRPGAAKAFPKRIYGATGLAARGRVSHLSVVSARRAPGAGQPRLRGLRAGRTPPNATRPVQCNASRARCAMPTV